MHREPIQTAVPCLHTRPSHACTRHAPVKASRQTGTVPDGGGHVEQAFRCKGESRQCCTMRGEVPGQAGHGRGTGLTL